MKLGYYIVGFFYGYKCKIGETKHQKQTAVINRMYVLFYHSIYHLSPEHCNTMWQEGACQSDYKQKVATLGFRPMYVGHSRTSLSHIKTIGTGLGLQRNTHLHTNLVEFTSWWKGIKNKGNISITVQRIFSLPLRGWSLLNVVLLVINRTRDLPGECSGDQ